MQTMTIPIKWRDAPPLIKLRVHVGYDPRMHLIDLWAWVQAGWGEGPHAGPVIEAAAGWRGPTGRLVVGLADAGWLESSGAATWLVRPWTEVLAVEAAPVAGLPAEVLDTIQKQRESTRERVRRFRERRKQASEANLPATVTSTVTAVTPDVTGVTGNAGYVLNSININSSTEKERTQRETSNATDAHAESDRLMAALFDDVASTPKPLSDIDTVWQAYADAVPRVRLTKQRQDLIKRRLKDYSVEDLCRSIRGYAKSKFHAGDNERGIKYQTLELWLRDAAHVEAGWRYEEQTDGKAKSMQQRGLAGIEDAWAAYESKQ